MNPGSPAPAGPAAGAEAPGALFDAGVDWAATALGAPQHWPQSLRTAMSIVSGSRHPMFLAWGPELAFVFNEAYRPILGAKAAGAQGRPFAELWSEIWPDIEPLVATALAGRATWSEDLPLVMRRHGFDETAYFTFSYSPIRDESGGVGGLFCACTETTAKVLAERRNAQLLAEQHDWIERLQGLFNQAPGFMAVLRGPQHCFEMANRAYYQLVGARELLGRPAREALPEVDGQGFFELLDKVWASARPFVGSGLQVRLRRTPGGALEDAYVDFVYQPLLDADGRVWGIFAQGHDVTERHRLVESLQQADARKDEFLAMLAHELRNPLAPVTNAVKLLARRDSLDPAGAAALAMIDRQVGHMRRLVDDLLEVSRITRGAIELKPEPMRLEEAARHATEALRPALEARRQRLALVPPPAPLALVADPVRVAQILENLLTNASKYTPEGGAIRVELADEGDAALVRVIDDGIGIDPRRLEQVFELFSQEDAALDRSAGGLGIGLAMVRKLARLHGGHAWAESAGPGHGATFTVRLPKAPPEARDAAAGG